MQQQHLVNLCASLSGGTTGGDRERKQPITTVECGAKLCAFEGSCEGLQPFYTVSDKIVAQVT